MVEFFMLKLVLHTVTAGLISFLAFLCISENDICRMQKKMYYYIIVRYTNTQNLLLIYHFKYILYRNILCIRFVHIKQPRFYECDHNP